MSVLTVPPRWYAVHTRSNFEKKVAGDLLSRSVEAFLPLVTEIHRWKDRRKEVELPVFPGYVFVRMEDRAEDRLNVLRSNGAVRILGHNGAIEPVPEQEIEGIRQLIASSLPFYAHPFVREGARVRMKRGPLEGVEGIIARCKTQSRLVLSIEMLSRSVATEVYMRDVEVLHAPRVAKSSLQEMSCIRI